MIGVSRSGGCGVLEVENSAQNVASLDSFVSIGNRTVNKNEF